MSDLGDISSLLKEGSGVSNLDWLDVDEKQYRAEDILPRQNLQISPDLEALWSHEDKPATNYLEPNQAALPRTMGDLSQAHGPLRAKPADIVKAARQAMLQTMDAQRIEHALTTRFDGDSLKAASTELNVALQERGLLGRLYVAAADFPGCTSGKGLELAHKHAKGAPFVVAKRACADCAHATAGPVGGTNCAQFHKQIVLEVPYTDALADKVEGILLAKGRDIQASNLSPRERILNAFMAPAVQIAPPASMPRPIENVSRLTQVAAIPVPVVLPVDLTPQREATRKAIEAAFHAQRITVVEAQQAYKVIAASTITAEHLDEIRLAAAITKGELPLIAKNKPIENIARLTQVAAAPVPVVIPVDITPQREAARRAVEAAFQARRLTVTETQQAYQVIASPNVTVAHLEQIRVAAGGVPELVTPVYAGMGEQPLPAMASPEEAAKGLTVAQANTAQTQLAADKLASARRASPVVSLLRREMLKGRGPNELVTALRLAFDVKDLAATKTLWEPTFHEVGLFGVVYATQDSFEDCHVGADFLARHNPGVRVMVAGNKCSGCIYNKISRCLLYGKPLVASTEAALTPSMAATVIQEHLASGRLASRASVPTSGSPASILRAVHAAVETGRTTNAQASKRLNVQTAFSGHEAQMVTSGITRREIVKQASRYLNEGLYGKQLLDVMQSRFDPRDLIAAKDDLKVVLAEQGLQGIYYVDPSIYADYGHGCEEASRLHRARLVPDVKLGSKCASCTLQTKPGYCSKLNKNLVREPAYIDKLAQQREILASGPATEMSYDSLVNNGHSAMIEFEMGQRSATIEFNAPAKPFDVTVEFGNQGIKL